MPRRWIPSSGTYMARRRGLNWVLDLNDHVQKRIYLVGSYESLTLAALLPRLRPTDTFLDVGANIGAIALPVAKKLRRPGRVIAVEPARDTAAHLRMHVALNDLGDVVEIVEAGLSDREGEARLRLGCFGCGDVATRTFEGDLAFDSEPVRITTGDGLRHELGIERFDVIKIDVEGHERFTLEGLSDTFANRPPRVVVLEMAAETQQLSGGSLQDIMDHMTEMGYVGSAIRQRGLRPVPPDLKYANVIFELQSSKIED